MPVATPTSSADSPSQTRKKICEKISVSQHPFSYRVATKRLLKENHCFFGGWAIVDHCTGVTLFFTLAGGWAIRPSDSVYLTAYEGLRAILVGAALLTIPMADQVYTVTGGALLLQTGSEPLARVTLYLTLTKPRYG